MLGLSLTRLDVVFIYLVYSIPDIPDTRVKGRISRRKFLLMVFKMHS